MMGPAPQTKPQHDLNQNARDPSGKAPRCEDVIHSRQLIDNDLGPRQNRGDGAVNHRLEPDLMKNIRAFAEQNPDQLEDGR